MTDRYERIRAALSMGPTSVSWTQDIDEDAAYAMFCCRSAAEAAFVTACDPDTIRALLEERDTLEAENERLRALLRQALTALESSDWYIGQLERIVYSPDDTGTHEVRAKVQSTIRRLRERLTKGA